jgi:hypothetical protein
MFDFSSLSKVEKDTTIVIKKRRCHAIIMEASQAKQSREKKRVSYTSYLGIIGMCIYKCV